MCQFAHIQTCIYFVTFEWMHKDCNLKTWSQMVYFSLFCIKTQEYTKNNYAWPIWNQYLYLLCLYRHNTQLLAVFHNISGLRYPECALAANESSCLISYLCRKKCRPINLLAMCVCENLFVHNFLRKHCKNKVH